MAVLCGQQNSCQLKSDAVVLAVGAMMDTPPRHVIVDAMFHRHVVVAVYVSPSNTASINYQVKSGEVRSDRVGSSRIGSGRVRSSRVRSGQVRADHDVCTERGLHTATNFFIVSLAIADIMVAILVMPLAVYVEVRFHPLTAFLPLINFYLSVLYAYA